MPRVRTGTRRLARPVAVVVVCGCLGVASSVGIAWAIAVIEGGTYWGLGNWGEGERLVDAASWDWRFTHHRQLGVDKFDTMYWPGGRWRPPPPSLARSARPAAIPGWVPLPSAGVDWLCTATGYGLPLRCMRWSSNQSMNHGEMYFVGWAIPWNRAPKGSFTLPTAPIASGLIVSVVFWAAVWAGIIGAGRRGRGWRRRRRGWCAACGYNLSGGVGGVCPECGEARPGSGTLHV